MKNNPVIEVHSKTTCPLCKLSKELLTRLDVDFSEHVYDDFDARQAMYDQLGLIGDQRTVPQIIVDGTRIGGYADLERSDFIARLSGGIFDEEF